MQNLLLTNRFFLLILLFGFFHINSNAQTFTNKHNLIDDIESLLHSNPDQSLKVAQYLLSKTNTSNKEKAKAIYIRLRAANMQEDTKKLLVKQIQQALKSDEVKRKDFISASGLKKPR